MRLLVRATTIRAPAGPGQPRIYGIGQDRDSGGATAAIVAVLTAYGFDEDTGYATVENLSTDTAIGLDRDRGSARFLPNGGINYGRDSDRGYATHLLVQRGTDSDRGRAAPGFRARGTDGDTGRATASTGGVVYAYSRTLVVERQNDLTAETTTNYVLQLQLTDAWLKQSSLTGGRIRHVSAYDLVFETTAAARLDHEIEAYDGTAGTGIFAILMPSWALAVNQFIFRVRYGADL